MVIPVYGYHLQIHTVAVGAAIGQACLLLAAGSKGKRFMMPHAKGINWLLIRLQFCTYFYQLQILFLSVTNTNSSRTHLVMFSHDTAAPCPIIWIDASK